MHIFCILYFSILTILPNPPFDGRLPLEDRSHKYWATVMVDPGHGTLYNGRGVECGNVLAVGLALTRYLRQKGVRVVLTRNRTSRFEDLMNIKYARTRLKGRWLLNTLDNMARTLRARDTGCQAIIRLHTDAHKFRRFDIFYPDKQGYYNGYHGPSPLVSAYSYQLARCVIRSMTRYLSSRGIKRGYIKRESSLKNKKEIKATGGCFKCNLIAISPVIWIEMIGHGDPKNSKFIRRNASLFAKAIGNGVINYLRSYGSVPYKQLLPTKTAEKRIKYPGMDSFLFPWL